MVLKVGFYCITHSEGILKVQGNNVCFHLKGLNSACGAVRHERNWHVIFVLQVHVFYRKCGDIASCNCAVAARAGDDVIVIDKCGPSAQNTLGFYPLTVRLFRNGVLTPGFKLLSRFEGREHKVCTCRPCLTLHCKVLLRYTGSEVLFVWEVTLKLF